MPKSAMGFLKFALYVGAAVIVLEKTGILDKARAMVPSYT